jgi:hypothetical protein
MNMFHNRAALGHYQQRFDPGDLRSLLSILSIPRPRWLVVERLDRALVLSRPRGDLEEHILLDPLSSYPSPTESAWHTSVVRRA